MVKLPEKKEGITTEYNGYVLTCRPTGKSWQGVPTLAWFHENGEQAFRSINRKTTFIEPTTEIKSVPKTTKTFTVEPNFKVGIDRASAKEEYLHEYAVNAIKNRYPDMNTKLDVFGMIVNAYKQNILSLLK